MLKPMRILCVLVSIWALPTGSRSLVWAQERLETLSGEEESASVSESHEGSVAEGAPTMADEPSLEVDFQLQPPGERRLARRPAGWIIGGGLLGLAGLGGLAGSTYGLMQDRLELKAFAALALLAGITAAAGLALFAEGVKSARVRRRRQLVQALSGTLLRW